MTEGRGKRKSLFPQERKVSINPVTAKSPLIQDDIKQKFLKKFGATPDVNMKKLGPSSPKDKILIQDAVENEVCKVRPGQKAYPIGITPKQLQPGYLKLQP